MKSGFDAFVGNPPFLGGKRVSTVHGQVYRDWLETLHEETNGNADIVAHFYRRTFNFLRSNATFGLLATNTIAQGDTRAAGLTWICKNGGVIYDATKRYKWPGDSEVVTSIVHVQRDPARHLEPRLNGAPVRRISTFLLRDAADVEPVRLNENENRAFVGSYILGMGFTFDDHNAHATPLAEMQRLVAEAPRNAERISPYLGGDELNNSPTQAHSRYVIDFGDATEEEARTWPGLFRIVEAKVKPQREAASADVRKYPWWRFWNARRALYETIRDAERVLAIARVSDTVAFAFVPAKQVFSEQIVVFAVDSWSGFAVLQSRVHEYWARFMGSTLGDGLRYGPSDCFETFPAPEGWLSAPALDETGRLYDALRRSVMAANAEGLTATYNRFHDPSEYGDSFVALRQLHDALDLAVLAAYGWSDLQPVSEFAVIRRDDADDEGRRPKKARFRYGWPDDVREAVLGRLVALNAERAGVERNSGAAPRKRLAKAGDKPRSRRREAG